VEQGASAIVERDDIRGAFVLHLQGFDDKTTATRHKMKHEENRLLQQLAGCFPLDSIAHG
jgi:hypothetical protein